MKTPTPNPQTAKKPWYTIIPGLLFLVLCSGITGYMISEHNLGKQLKGNSNPDLCETFSYSSGEGEEYAPYLIENIQGLQAMKCDLSSYYKLNNNIDASSTSTWNYDEELDLNLGFEPVGDSQEIEDSPFTGSLDGNGYIISGLYINRPQTSGVGLFGHTNYGNGINDIALEGGSIIGHENVGALVGNVYGTEIQDSYSTTNVTGQNSIGGLVGYSEDNSIYRSYSSGTVTGQGSDGPNCSEIGDEPTCAETDGCYFEDGECWEQESEETGRNIGGLVGNASEDVSIYRSFATGNVSGTENVGGLVGYMDDESSTSNTYATGSVTGTNDYIGGLIGYLGDDSDIDYSYATGDVSGNDYLGGLVGYIDEFVEIEYSFAAGTVSGEGESFGGLVGDEDEENEISNSYFTDSDHNNDFGTLEEDGASAFYHASHDVYDDWNFSEDWYIDEGESYPYFQWNTAPITEVWVDDDYQEPCEEEGECDEYGSCDEEAQSACNNNCEESCGPDEECAETCSNNCQSQHCEPARYCSDDGHTWNRDCFDDIEDAMEKIVEGGAIHVASGEYDGFKANKTGVTVQGEIGATVNDDSYYVNGIDAGILVNAPNVTIKGMTIDGNDGDFDAGIYIYDYEDKEEGVYGVRIEGNTIHVPSDYSCECGSGMAGIMARSDEGTPTVIINNIITYSVEENGNGDTSSLYGITLYGYNDPTYQVTGNTVTNVEIGLYITGDDLTGVVIQDNQFSNNEGGIMVNDGFERVTINNNAIFDNEEYGVVNDDYEEGPMLNAARNWWGDETGPSHEENPGGEGDQISDGVNFMPYYVNSTRTTLSDGSNAGAAFTSETEGRAELPPALTEVILNSSTVLDLSEQVETVDEEEGEIVLGGETFDWDDFPIKDLEGESTDMTNLDETLTIGDQEVELGAGIVLESGTDGENVVISNSEYDTAEVSIPDGTAVLAPAGCDFQIQPPTPGTASGDAPSGFSFGGTVIEVGSSECVLLFDQPMIIEIDGVFTNMAYRPTGSENWINIDRCGGTYNSPSTPAFPGECYTSNGIDKTKVYTYHLTGFSQTVSVAGGGGSAPSMKKPNSITIAYFLPYRGTAKSVHLVDESVSLQQSEGIFTQPVELEEIYDHYKVEISMGTGVTDLEGNAYLGMITSPEKVSASKMKLPGEFDFKNAVKVQATDGKVLIFDKEITVVVPVDVTDKNERNLKVFAYNADLQELKLIGKGGRVNKSDDVITVKSNYLGTFVIMDTKGGDLTAYMEEEFKAAAPKEETVEVVRIPDVLEQPIPQFSDTTGHWAEKYIDELRIRGVVEGKEQDKFAPETGIKLSQLQEISQKAFGVNVPYSAYRTIVGEVLSHENRDLTRPEALKVMLETAGVALTIPEKSLSFRDVLVGAWYEKYIKYAQGNGLIHGLGNELFGTEKPITRAETTKVVAKLWEMIEKEGTFKAAAPKKEVRIPAVLEQPIPPFKDTKDHFAGKYIEELRIRGVIEGKEKDEFAPEEGMKLSDLLELSHKSFGVGVPYPAYEVVLNEVVSGANRDVTRAEALRIVLETSDVDIEIPEKRLSFSDVMVDSWYEKYISYAQGNGLIYGVSKDNFGPEKTITRAEVAKIIAKLWEMMGSK